jgi:hypothetical protein
MAATRFRFFINVIALLVATSIAFGLYSCNSSDRKIANDIIK